MRSALLLLALCPDLGAQAFVEVTTDKSEYFVQERIQVRLRFGFETLFIQDHLIQPFRAPLDVPARLDAPWLAELSGTALVDPGADTSGDGGLSFVLNDSQTEAPQVEDRRGGEQPFTVVEITRTYLPLEPGPLQISPPVLRYDHATAFVEDFLSARVPKDRLQGEVTGNGLRLEIQPLPAEGRPETFTGAVGHFTVRAETAARAVEVGESFKLMLHIEGEGNMQHLRAPDLAELPGFHVLGKIEDISVARTVTYDLAPISADVTEVPSIPFSFFDPRPPAGYDTLLTSPIPLRVRASTTERMVPGEDDIYDIKPVEGSEPSRSISPAIVIAVLLAPWLVVLGVLYRRRARTRNRVDPADLRARAAAATFRERLEDPALKLDQTLAEFLAAHLGISAAAVIAPGLQARLEASGIPTDLAHRTATLLDALIDARFGGGHPDFGPKAATELVDLLDRAFWSAGQT